jgi:hypothetical protein
VFAVRAAVEDIDLVGETVVDFGVVFLVGDNLGELVCSWTALNSVSLAPVDGELSLSSVMCCDKDNLVSP